MASIACEGPAGLRDPSVEGSLRPCPLRLHRLRLRPPPPPPRRTTWKNEWRPYSGRGKSYSAGLYFTLLYIWTCHVYPAGYGQPSKWALDLIYRPRSLKNTDWKHVKIRFNFLNCKMLPIWNFFLGLQMRSNDSFEVTLKTMLGQLHTKCKFHDFFHV